MTRSKSVNHTTKDSPTMSLHQHIHALNNIGQRLADLTSRARMCADAIEGGRATPPDTRPEISKGPVSATNLDAQLNKVVEQYDDVVSLLAQQLDRIEMQVHDQPTPTGSLAGMAGHAAKQAY
jgi:hypothetical protein